VVPPVERAQRPRAAAGQTESPKTPPETAMRTPIVDPRPQVGAPNPELETSPIVGEEDQVEVEPNVAAEGRCLFNGVAYRIGDLVLSGSEVLQCQAPGVWVREGELRPRHLGGGGR
jgi:hypothetical protein